MLADEMSHFIDNFLRETQSIQYLDRHPRPNYLMVIESGIGTIAPFGLGFTDIM